MTTAVRLLELYPDTQISIFTEELSPNTTSDVSAGFWKPYCLEGNDDSLIRFKYSSIQYFIILNNL